MQDIPFENPVMVACFAKAGSTFLTKVVSHTLGIPHIQVYGPSAGNEQYPCREQIDRVDAVNFVTQMHCPATIPNLEVIREYGFRTIVLTRNIFDVLVSFHDFYLFKEWERVEFSAAFYDNYGKLSPEGQKEFLLELVMPWYVKFYVSWFKNEQAGNMVWGTYEEMLLDKGAFVAGLLDRLAIPYEIDRLERAVDAVDSSKSTRKNVGVTGRGQAFFTPEARERAARITRFYPDVDFSRMGL